MIEVVNLDISLCWLPLKPGHRACLLHGYTWPDVHVPGSEAEAHEAEGLVETAVVAAEVRDVAGVQ